MYIIKKKSHPKPDETISFLLSQVCKEYPGVDSQSCCRHVASSTIRGNLSHDEIWVVIRSSTLLLEAMI